MKIIRIIAAKDSISTFFLDPIRQNKKYFLSRGYKIIIHNGINCIPKGSDVLIILSKPMMKYLRNKEPVFSEQSPIIKKLKYSRKYNDKLIWMDISDSTGVTHFEILKYVDLYLKKQLLKDMKLYDKEFYGGRIFTDYYHNKFRIVDKNPFLQFHPLDQKYAHKVGLSWNICMGNIFQASNILRSKIKRSINYTHVNYNFPFISPASKRNTDIFLKISSTVERNTVRFHRNTVYNKIKQISDKKNLNSYSGKSNRSFIDLFNQRFLSYKHYNNKMKDSKIVLGPFSYGDINTRDYESIINGSLLLKPSISYLNTWPNIFKEYETYIPFKWDFSDIDERNLINILKNDDERINIVNNAQETYMSYISDAGMEKFCDRFISFIDGVECD